MHMNVTRGVMGRVCFQVLYMHELWHVLFCFQSNKHQEYEYFLKWKGYGEEDNSWVPASLMNCWDLLQRYLSANIFNSPSTAASLSTPVPINRTVTPKGKGHSRSKEPRRNRGLKSGRADRTVHSTKANGHPVAHANDPVTSNERSPVSKSEASKGKTGELFSTPKPPLAAKLGQRRQKVVERPSHVKHKRQQPRKLEKIDECDSRPLPCHSTALPSPSASPLMSSCEELSSSQSDCSVSVDDTFRLYLDSDEDSNTSGSQNLLRESPFREEENSEQSSYVQSRSPKLHHISISKAQHRQVNGFKNSESRHAKVTLKCLPNGHSGKPKEKFLMRKNGVSQNLPTSTTSSAADNTDSDTSESWSKRRLRKRGRSSSPTPSLDSTNLETTVDQEEVSSTISPPVVSPQVLQRRLSPSPEYQQELLEWQFLLNKQCRPSEAFILVENRIDEAPIPWNVKYITTNMYGEGVPNPQKPDMAARICGCTCYIMGKRCLPKNEHCCPKMAGADFPYSLAGKVRLPPGNPIYECNSRCSCPPDCTNRIVQHGRKINMCIFRTANGRGWGVKTMEPIKPNTFVTEYVGEVVTTDEAERRGQLYDQEGRTYLFDLDFNCDDNAFTIDAAHYGNISHFFNHSVR